MAQTRPRKLSKKSVPAGERSNESKSAGGGLTTKQEIVKNWLPRYTGVALKDFGRYILLTNFEHYIELFAHQHKVPVQLHPELEVSITINVARSADEAERLARGEDVTVRRQGGADEDEAEAVVAAAEAVFEPGVAGAETEEGEDDEPEAKAASKPKGKKAKAEAAKAE